MEMEHFDGLERQKTRDLPRAKSLLDTPEDQKAQIERFEKYFSRMIARLLRIARSPCSEEFPTIRLRAEEIAVACDTHPMWEAVLENQDVLKKLYKDISLLVRAKFPREGFEANISSMMQLLEKNSLTSKR